MDLSEAQWQQIVARKEDKHPRFVFGVKTTGIYCIAGCPARTPKRENARFFDTPKAAEMNGFRACKRCKPNAAWRGDN